MADIRVHIDTLEYTRQGLKTREPIDLTVGQHNRVVLVRPERRTPIGDGRGGFQHDSSFPLPATLSVFWHLRTPLSAFRHLPSPTEHSPTKGVFQLYAHAAASGDDDYNKGLTDRRAAVGLALLRADVDAFKDELAASGYESLEYHQVMLRVLGCDPGPVDGEWGTLTEQAVTFFQRRYEAGDFHRHTPATALRTEPFPESGELDDVTVNALIEAFVVANGGHVPAENVHPSHPAQGCSEFNSLEDAEDWEQRRLSLVSHADVPEHSGDAPCATAAAAACAVVDDKPMRCMWYREHVRPSVRTPPMFVDPRWLPLPDGRFFLSALTTLPDETPVTFQVFDSSADGLELLDPISEEIFGVASLGVAGVVWAPPDHHPGAAPPAPGRATFRVRNDTETAEASAPWPILGPARVLIATPDPDGDLTMSFRLRSTDGKYNQILSLNQATEMSPHFLQLEFVDVPLESRFILESDAAGGSEFDDVHFEDTVLRGLEDGCAGGNQCTEPEQPQPRPEPDDDLADDDLDDDLDPEEA